MEESAQPKASALGRRLDAGKSRRALHLPRSPLLRSAPALPPRLAASAAAPQPPCSSHAAGDASCGWGKKGWGREIGGYRGKTDGEEPRKKFWRGRLACEHALCRHQRFRLPHQIEEGRRRLGTRATTRRGLAIRSGTTSLCRRRARRRHHPLSSLLMVHVGRIG